jgi:hypothetical protein
VVFRGTTVDGARIVLVDRVPATSTDGFRTWTAVLQLPEGTHDITAVAYDARGGTARASVQVTVAGTFGVTGAAMAFVGVRRSPTPPPDRFLLKIRGDHARWRIDGPVWVRLSAYSGNGPATVTVSAIAFGTEYGVSTGQVTVTDDDSGEVRQFPVSLELRAARVVVAPASLDFTVNNVTPASARSATVLVTDETNGTAPSESVPWTVESISAPWLSVTPSSGGTSPPTRLTVSVDPAVLQTMAWGNYSATIFITWQNAQEAGRAFLYVTVGNGLRLPVVDFAAPYVGIAGRPGPLTLRGKNFQNLGSSVTVRVGDVDVPVVPEADTQVRIQYPAMPAGRYPVGIRSSSDLQFTNAELVVVPPSSFARWTIPAPGARERLIWDGERQVLYGVNRATQSLERYRLSGGAWVADAPFALPGLQDADLTPDGRALVAVTGQAIFEIDLRSGWASRVRYTSAANECSLHPARVTMGNDGRALVLSTGNACASDGLYDTASHDLGLFGSKNAVGVAGGADGSRLYTLPAAASRPVEIFDVLTRTWLSGRVSPYPVTRMSVSGDASRVILDGTEVCDHLLRTLGSLGPPGFITLASRDSTRAFTYQDGGGQAQLTIYDLTASTGPFPAIRAIPLGIPTTPSSMDETYSAAATPDDSTVFISRDGFIEVVPVN